MYASEDVMLYILTLSGILLAVVAIGCTVAEVSKTVHGGWSIEFDPMSDRWVARRGKYEISHPEKERLQEIMDNVDNILS